MEAAGFEGPRAAGLGQGCSAGCVAWSRALRTCTLGGQKAWGRDVLWQCSQVYRHVAGVPAGNCRLLQEGAGRAWLEALREVGAAVLAWGGQGGWHVGLWPAWRSSGRCRWSRGEAGSWRGIWLSCWTCTAGRQGGIGEQGMGTASAGHSANTPGGRACGWQPWGRAWEGPSRRDEHSAHTEEPECEGPPGPGPEGHTQAFLPLRGAGWGAMRRAPRKGGGRACSRKSQVVPEDLEQQGHEPCCPITLGKEGPQSCGGPSG